MPQLVENPNSRAYHDAALTKLKEWVLFKIQGLTLNQSFSLVGVLQTLFKEQEPKQLGSLSNKGSKIQLAAIFLALGIIEVMEMLLNVDVDWHLAFLIFVKPLKLSQI
jgi:hypothetical protein